MLNTVKWFIFQFVLFLLHIVCFFFVVGWLISLRGFLVVGLFVCSGFCLVLVLLLVFGFICFFPTA